jgi:hypothetical protein
MLAFQRLGLFLMLVFSLAPVFAQTTAGSMVGTVYDPSGGLIAGAQVTLTNMDTGIATRTITNAAGEYVVTPLPIGRYSVAVEAKGFKTSVRNDVTVNVQDRVRVDASLEVGSMSETVHVEAETPLLQTDTSYLGQVVESQRIVDLPLNGRYFSRLAVLTAGTAPSPAGARDEKTGGFSSNGVRPYQNNYLLDGVDNNSMSEDMVNQASYVVGPPPDAIAEFRVQTNSMSAEFGRSGGAVLNVTVKSGSNGFHGTAYEFLRNSALDAKNYFDSPTDPIPPFKLNQFGFSVGGPIKRNRTFFFGDYQGTRQRTGHTFFATVPPPAWRVGDFSGFQPIFDPENTSTDAAGNVVRAPFAGNQIPQDRWNPISKKLMDEFPQPNVPGSVSSTGVASNYLSNPVEPDTTNQFDIRIDHKFSDSDSVFGRVSFSNNSLQPPGAIPPPLDAADFASGDFLNDARNIVITETHIFTPRTVNELRLGYSRNRSERLQFNSTQNFSQQLGIPGIPFGPNNGGLPQFNVDGLNSFGSAEYQPTVEIQNIYHIIDSLSLIRGRHTIKIGAEIKPRVNFTILQPPYPRGEFNFSGTFTHDANPNNDSGLGAADFLLGVLDTSILSSIIDNTFQQPGQFYYVQDDFKVTSKLTLNLGLRYEFVTFAMEKYNAEANFNVATNTLDIPGRTDPLPPSWYPQIAVNRNAPRSLVPNEKHDFGPRFGFAYNVFHNTVIRGGYGIFYSSYEAGPLSIPNPGNNPPFFSQTTFQPVSFLVPNPKVNNISQGFPLDTLTNPDAPSLFSLDPNFHNPYVQHWNFSVQQQLGWNTVWEVAYAGSKGTKLYEFREGNPIQPSSDPNADSASRRPRPYLGDLTYWCACNSSTYHSLQTKVEKRLSNGLSFLTAYTFGKAIDETSQASLGFHSGGGARSPDHPEWEKSRADFDITHRFVNSISYSLPFGKGRPYAANMNGLGEAVLGGWELQGIQSINTGIPRTVRGRSLCNCSGEGRPDVVPGVSLYPENQDPSLWFNPAAFTDPAFGTFGNSGRNILSTASQVNIDTSVFKNFRITERAQLQFRSEFFNMINHPNFRSNSLVVRYYQANAGAYTAAWPSRQIQFALKLIF